MAMFIVKPWYRKKNPDDYFDPVTHIATEENFIKFLECGVYDSKYIGYKVQLSNSVDYNNGLWVIADVGHNANQPNTYDLISEDCFYERVFHNYEGVVWRNSDIRTWLNSTVYNGFSENFKSHMSNITYNSEGSTYNDDKVILPSLTEMNGGTSAVITDGTAYPIFTDTASRIKNYNGSAQSWWTRSQRMYTGGMIWTITASGETSMSPCNWSRYLAPILRVS